MQLGYNFSIKRSIHPILIHFFKNKFLYFFMGLFISGTLLLLNGCSNLQVQDGAPPYNVDASKIPNATPRPEARSRYGNMPSYRVHGKKYHVMSSATNYEEKGIASWYGSKFHKLRTSSGERYDMLAMTGAHKSLPLPTYVEVTNLRNGNKVIVKVNDRGPFAPNRIIDLSYVAAKKLDMIGRGTTYVRVKAIDPATAYQHQNLFVQKKTKQPIYASNSPTTSKVYLQVGAFRNRVYAEKLKNRLGSMITSPVAVTHLAKTSKRLYRVKIGPIKNTIAADSIKKKLRAIGLTAQHVKV